MRKAKGESMKTLLVALSLLGTISAFAAEKRIECMSANGKIHVALVSSTDSFDQVDVLTIINSTFAGKDLQVQNPRCLVIQRESQKGPFVIVNCEDEKILVNQFLAKGSDGEATLKAGLRRHSLACKTN